jgi:hypothetical protein
MDKTNIELAAPALLESLENVVAVIHSHNSLEKDKCAWNFTHMIIKARAAIALAKAGDIDPVTKLPFNKDQPYCGECNRPADACACGEF